MRMQRKIGLIIMLVSAFVLFSSYFFTTPDQNGREWQKLSLLNKISYEPKLSELVISDGAGYRFEEVNGKYEKRSYDDSWSLIIGYKVHYSGLTRAFANEVYAPTFYGFTIRYNYLATICLLFFFIGLYIFVVFQNKDEKS